MRLSFMVLPVIALIIIDNAMAMPNSSDDIPQHVLDECDEQTKLYGDNNRIILAATEELVALGVFAENEFRDVRIGFCDLRRVNGPVATTSCARDIILLDKKYANNDQSFVLRATLAHEMKHYFQHIEQKARFGESYCFSDRYNEDKAWMEEEADKFGDNAAALLFIGRQIEIKNECPATVSVYLEADKPKSATRRSRDFIVVAQQSTVLAPERSTSKFFKFYAQSEPYRGRRWYWRSSTNAHKRNINGKTYELGRITLSNQSRSTGPFLMNLSCP